MSTAAILLLGLLGLAGTHPANSTCRPNNSAAELLLDDGALLEWQRAMLRAQAAALPGCVAADFARRLGDWHVALRGVLRGSAAARVTDAYVPCGGADALSALAAFPRARTITIVSCEPPLPPAGPSALGRALLHGRAADLRTGGGGEAADGGGGGGGADGDDVLGCLREAGGYQLGHLLRQTAARTGMAAVLVAALGAARGSVRGLRAAPQGSLAGVAMDVTFGQGAELAAGGSGSGNGTKAQAAPAGIGRAAFTLRYVQADLSNATQLGELRALERRDGGGSGLFFGGGGGDGTAKGDRGGRIAGVTVGVLIKGAEVCFASVPPRPEHGALSRHVLATADVLLQDTQGGVRLPLVERWTRGAADAGGSGGGGSSGGCGGVLALGSLVTGGGGERLEGQEEREGLQRVWQTIGAEGWRSLRGIRFGYCRGERDTGAVAVAARTHPEEPAAKGDSGMGEQGQRFFCAALLAWRCGRGWST